MPKPSCHPLWYDDKAMENGARPSDPDHCTYHVVWSEEDGMYVGLCDEFPSLSCLDASQDDALAGIKQFVTAALEDIARE